MDCPQVMKTLGFWVILLLICMLPTPIEASRKFFGSFGFIQALCEGQSVEDILGSNCEEPIFMMNPLVWSFCLWFLSSPVFEFPHRDECYDKLTSYVAKQINQTVLNTEEIRIKYPAIDLLTLEAQSDMNFFREVLKKCANITTLQLPKSNKANAGLFMEITSKLLGVMKRDFIDKLTEISIGRFKPINVDDTSLTISIFSRYGDGMKLLDLLLHEYRLSQRDPQIYLRIVPSCHAEWDMTRSLSKHVKELEIMNTGHHASLHGLGGIPHCPILTKIKADAHTVHVDESFVRCVWKAIGSQKLPCLRHIEICHPCTHRFYWPAQVEVSFRGATYLGNDCSNTCFIVTNAIRLVPRPGRSACSTITFSSSGMEFQDN